MCYKLQGVLYKMTKLILIFGITGSATEMSLFFLDQKLVFTMFHFIPTNHFFFETEKGRLW